ncbi:hypothetical protein D3C75_657730 [compost metagenome]
MLEAFSKQELCPGISLLCCFCKPAGSLCVILLHYDAMIKEVAQIALRRGKTLLCR